MKHLQQIPIEKILFIDIETVPLENAFNDLNEAMQAEWQHKFQFIKHNEAETFENSFRQKAGVYAEFAKIICISVGRFKWVEGEKYFSVKSFYGDDEKNLLQEFSELISQQHTFKFICGHNIKEFDVPFIARRMIINQIELPPLFDIGGKKSFEVDYLIDTLHYWKFGDYKSYTSLALLTAVMNIPTPKSDISGKDVARVYYEENNLKRIEKYCKQDVVAVAQLFLKFRMEKILSENQIKIVE